MKRGRLPLTALRSFEAAGRHESFTLAAEELYVSQAAISRQIRGLEEWLGHALFERHHRKVVLTDRGRLLLDIMTVSFDNIGQALDGMRADQAEAILPVSVEPSFAACWLVPRLDRFRAAHPEIDVAVDAEPHLTDFKSGKAALAIRWSEAVTSWPHVQAEKLTDVAASPVLSPNLLAAGPAVKTPADLRHYTLLHEADRTLWTKWLQRAGVKNPQLHRGPLFADTLLTVQAATRRHGVALSSVLLAGEELRAGNLVKPFDIDVPAGAYWLVAPDLAKMSPTATAFVAWLRTELRNDPADMEKYKAREQL